MHFYLMSTCIADLIRRPRSGAPFRHASCPPPPARRGPSGPAPAGRRRRRGGGGGGGGGGDVTVASALVSRQCRGGGGGGASAAHDHLLRDELLLRFVHAEPRPGAFDCGERTLKAALPDPSHCGGDGDGGDSQQSDGRRVQGQPLGPDRAEVPRDERLELATGPQVPLAHGLSGLKEDG